MLFAPALIALIALVGTGQPTAAVSAQQPAYSIVDLGDWYANSISSRGHVAGWGQIGSTYDGRAIRWTPATGRTHLAPATGFQESNSGEGVNAEGHVVGWSWTYNGGSTAKGPHATLWRGGAAIDLGTLGGAKSNAYGINDAGFVVGGALTANEERHAFIWTNGVMVDLGTFGGAPTSAADINARNEIVGVGGGPASYRGYIAVPVPGPLFASYPMVDLGTLGGMQAVPHAINDRAQVVGESTLPGEWHAFLWQKGVMKDLGTLTGPSGSSKAYDLNATAQIVGSSVNAGGASVPAYQGTSAVLWHNGAVVDLNTLVPADSGWHLTVADGINDSGRIVGWGVKLNQQWDRLHAFMLVPRVKLAAFTVQPTSVVGGQTAQGRITLNRPAPAGGASVALANTFPSPDPAATVAQVVVVPAGASTRTFPIPSRRVKETLVGKLTASYNGSSKAVTLEVRAGG